MADGHDPEGQTPLSTFLSGGLKTKEDVDTAVMAAIFRQTQLLEILSTITAGTMKFIDNSVGRDHSHANKIMNDMDALVKECKQINMVLLDYSGRDQVDEIDGKR